LKYRENFGLELGVYDLEPVIPRAKIGLMLLVIQAEAEFRQQFVFHGIQLFGVHEQFRHFIGNMA